MAIPVTPEGRLYCVGATLGGVWGTEIAVGAGDEIKVLSDGDLAKARNQSYLMLKESGNTFLARGIAGPVENCDFSPEAYMRYSPGQLGTIIACAFGADTSPALVETGVYLHTLTWEESSLGLFTTYVSEYPDKVYSVPSAKTHKVVFSLQDGVVKVTPTMRGNIIINDSLINGATQTDALTPVDPANEVRLMECVGCWLAVYDDADALEAADAKEVSGFEITFARGLESAKISAGQSYLSEPQEEDFSDIRVKLDFPYADAFNQAMFANFIDGEHYSMSLFFTGALLGAAEHYQFNIHIPKMRLSAVPDTTKAGLIRVTAEFQAVDATLDEPEGFTSYFPYIELQNEASASYLA